MSTVAPQPRPDAIHATPVDERTRGEIQRVFSNWLEIPRHFKDSLVKYVAQNLSEVETAAGQAKHLVGEIKWWPFLAVPDTKWELCNGQAVSRTEARYRILHEKVAALGYPAPFGPGDGSTTCFSRPRCCSSA